MPFRSILFFFLAAVPAQAQMFGNQNPSPAPFVPLKIPRASIDLLQFQGTVSDSTRVDLYTAIPYSSLVFLYSADNYIADYSVSMQVLHGDSEVASRGESREATESVPAHRDRIARENYREDVRQISFQLRAGTEYTFRISIEDITSKKEFDTSIHCVVREFSENKSAMSDFLFYSHRSGTNIVPFIGNDISRLEEMDLTPHQTSDAIEHGIFAMLYHIPPDSVLEVETEVLPQDSNTADSITVLAKYSMPFRTEHEKSGLTSPGPVPQAPMFIPIRFDGLWPGTFTLRAFLLPRAQDTSLAGKFLQQNALASAERTIRVRIASGIPNSLTDMDLAIEELRTIATSTEWDSLSSAKTPKEKRGAIVQFWNEKARTEPLAAFHQDNSDRAMKVFYDRIDYADQHFTTAFGPGWKSDRGRVYLSLGPADGVESRTTPNRMSPVLIWNYPSLGFQYTFIDEYNLGDFRLRGLFPPEGTFIIDR